MGVDNVVLNIIREGKNIPNMNAHTGESKFSTYKFHSREA